ncbi:nucleoside-diphosphate sugar epimerase/dehydratase [Bacteroides graminisolvens]|uniref:UDP-N-acetylglucosamine 4,6-dehydratase family protein n=1 Tax=Bacteroides graminisolvens TaxID=477666 RepID=UPI0029C8C7A0|nr:nucleoside-diphosphate sugar epimerase/dehydratase [Bacteroides graminisolvens]
MNKRSVLKVLLNFKYINRWVVFSTDLIISGFSSFIALLFIVYVSQTDFTLNQFLLGMVTALGGSALSFILLGTYKGIIRHSGLMEVGRLAISALLKILCMAPLVGYILTQVTSRFYFIGLVIDFSLTFFFLVGFRVTLTTAYRFIMNRISGNRDKLLVYMGPQDTMALNHSLTSKLGRYEVEGYLSPNRTNSLRIGGQMVYPAKNYDEFKQLVLDRQIKYVLFTRHADVEKEQDRLIRYCTRAKVRMLMLPSMDELKDGKVCNRSIPELRIEDLLGRDEIEINMTEVETEFSGKVVLVTGAAGSIGSELCRQLAGMHVKRLLLFDSAETPLHNLRLEMERCYPDLKFEPIIGDVRIEKRLRMLFEKYHPQVVFHAAAYKHVPLMEENPCEAVLVNVIGSRQVADLALEYGAEKMIMVSTDKAVNPTNVMGASKRLAEIYVQSLGTAIREDKVKGHTQFITTRFGNVLGSNGSVIPRFKEQIENGGPVTVTHPDIIRFFMTIPEACRLVLEAGTMGKGNEIFVFEMGKAVKIVDLATRMIELAGYIPYEDIKIEFTGLRPGEKLYEEVLSNEENTLPTPHKKIMIAKVRRYEYSDILADYERFDALSRNVEVIPTVALMKQIVPEFISRNSRFEELDK